MDLGTVLEKETAPTTPLGINGVYEALASIAPYRATLEEARRQEQSAREEYDRRIAALQERCSHAVVAETGRSALDPVEDPSSHERLCLCCNARETVYAYQYARPTYRRITAPRVEMYISDQEAFRALERAAPLSPTRLRQILRSKDREFPLEKLIGEPPREKRPSVTLRRR